MEDKYIYAHLYGYGPIKIHLSGELLGFAKEMQEWEEGSEDGWRAEYYYRVHDHPVDLKVTSNDCRLVSYGYEGEESVGPLDLFDTDDVHIDTMLYHKCTQREDSSLDGEHTVVEILEIFEAEHEMLFEAGVEEYVANCSQTRGETIEVVWE